MSNDDVRRWEVDRLKQDIIRLQEQLRAAVEANRATELRLDSLKSTLALIGLFVIYVVVLTAILAASRLG